MVNTTYVSARRAVTAIASLTVVCTLRGQAKSDEADYLLKNKASDILRALLKELEKLVAAG
eukprot:6518498-Pyramimonas_sp.AAC.1